MDISSKSDQEDIEVDEIRQIIKRFSTTSKEVEKEQILAALADQKAKLNEYLSELVGIKKSLDSWKPAHIIR